MKILYMQGLHRYLFLRSYSQQFWETLLFHVKHAYMNKLSNNPGMT